MGVFIIVAIIIIAIVVSSHAKQVAIKERIKVRKERIYEKYGCTEIADRIINKTIWVGESTDQLLDSLDKPIDIDENVLKTKRKEIWKYYQKSTNRFGLKIMIENGLIVGWDEKL